MPDWTTCPGCGLRHTIRPDGVCPRCRERVAGAAGTARPDAHAEPALAMVYDQPAVSSAAKAAALVLIANGVLALVATLAVGGKQGPAAMGGLVSMAIDFVLGGYLLAGNERALWWAKLRVGIGLVILPFVAYAAGGLVLAAVQLGFSAGLLSLLTGAPGTFRLAVGVIGTGLCLALEAGTVIALGFGRNPLTSVVLRQQTEGAPVQAIEGRQFAYRLRTSRDGWYQRKVDLLLKERSGADRWLVHPDRDAHVIVFVREVGPIEGEAMGRIEDAVLEHARRSSQAFTVVERRALANAQAEGRLVHARATRDGMELELLFAIYAREPLLYQITAFARERGFATIEPQLLEWVSSLETPGWEAPATTPR